MKKIIFNMVLVLCVPASVWATAYSLPTYGSTANITGTVGGTAIVTEMTQSMQNSVSAGTGVIDPFLTIQNKGSQSGMNTDGATIYDQKRSGGGYTRSLLASTLGTFQAGSTSSSPGGYFNFMLDVNQSSAKPLITLTELQLFLVSAGNGGSLTQYSDLTSLGTKVFDMGDNSVTIDYSLWKGSGQSMDALFQIPTFDFNSGDFLYFWSAFTDANAGFEEWTAQTETAAPVPEPGTLMLLGVGMLGLAFFRKRHANKSRGASVC